MCTCLVRDFEEEIIGNRLAFANSRPQRTDVDSRTFRPYLQLIRDVASQKVSSGSLAYYDPELENEFAAWEKASDEDFAQFEAGL
jgi:hypothetical protein